MGLLAGVLVLVLFCGAWSFSGTCPSRDCLKYVSVNPSSLVKNVCRSLQCWTNFLLGVVSVSPVSPVSPAAKGSCVVAVVLVFVVCLFVFCGCVCFLCVCSSFASCEPALDATTETA